MGFEVQRYQNVRYGILRDGAWLKIVYRFVHDNASDSQCSIEQRRIGRVYFLINIPMRHAIITFLIPSDSQDAGALKFLSVRFGTIGLQTPRLPVAK